MQHMLLWVHEFLWKTVRINKIFGKKNDEI